LLFAEDCIKIGNNSAIKSGHAMDVNQAIDQGALFCLPDLEESGQNDSEFKTVKSF